MQDVMNEFDEIGKSDESLSLEGLKDKVQTHRQMCFTEKQL